MVRGSGNNGLYGYAFHDSCWCLLKACYQNHSIPFERLYDVFGSLVCVEEWNACPRWGYYYGGLFRLHQESRYPWEYDKIEHANSRRVRNTHRDPYRVPQVQSLLQKQPESPPNGKIGKAAPGNQTEVSRGHLMKLPQEILDEIIMYLPTADALRCRYASRDLARTFFSQRFWATRFGTNGECSFLFEIQAVNKSPRNWRSLYHYLNGANIQGPLRNRKRVWRLSQLLIDMSRLVWCGSPTSLRKSNHRHDRAMQWQGLYEL